MEKVQTAGLLPTVCGHYHLPPATCLQPKKIGASSPDFR